MLPYYSLIITRIRNECMLPFIPTVIHTVSICLFTHLYLYFIVRDSKEIMWLELFSVKHVLDKLPYIHKYLVFTNKGNFHIYYLILSL